MKKATISQIKEKVFTTGFTEDEYKVFQADERKGVQKILAQYEKQQEKKEQLREQFEAMKEYENHYRSEGKWNIAGIDEAGRGPIAGPVVAAAVILPEDFYLEGLYDSKALNERQKNDFFDYIKVHARSFGIGIVPSEKIDEINIYEATKLAMHKAIAQLDPQPDQLLIDAVKLPTNVCEVDAFPKGDQRSISIAAASVLAKVTRDRYMEELHEKLPAYEFNRNAGYGTKAHLDALKAHGATPFHRKTFAPVKEVTQTLF